MRYLVFIFGVLLGLAALIQAQDGGGGSGGDGKKGKKDKKPEKMIKAKALKGDVKDGQWPKVKGPALEFLLEDMNQDFMKTWQPYADRASHAIGPKTQNLFVAKDLCSSEFPCTTITNASTGKMTKDVKGEAKPAPIPMKKMDKFLSHLAKQKTVKLGHAIHRNLLYGGEVHHASIIARLTAFKKQEADAHQAVGMIFDAWKMMAFSKKPQAIRAVLAKTDDKPLVLQSVCLFPKGSNKAQADNFCQGKDKKEKGKKSKDDDGDSEGSSGDDEKKSKKGKGRKDDSDESGDKKQKSKGGDDGESGSDGAESKASKSKGKKGKTESGISGGSDGEKSSDGDDKKGSSKKTGSEDEGGGTKKGSSKKKADKEDNGGKDGEKDEELDRIENMHQKAVYKDMWEHGKPLPKKEDHEAKSESKKTDKHGEKEKSPSHDKSSNSTEGATSDSKKEKESKDPSKQTEDGKEQDDDESQGDAADSPEDGAVVEDKHGAKPKTKSDSHGHSDSERSKHADKHSPSKADESSSSGTTEEKTQITVKSEHKKDSSSKDDASKEGTLQQQSIVDDESKDSDSATSASTGGDDGLSSTQSAGALSGSGGRSKRDLEHLDGRSPDGSQTGACGSEGMWNCIDGTSFQRCASGQWSVAQPMAPGTKCKPGQGDQLSMAKRDVHFGYDSLPSLAARGIDADFGAMSDSQPGLHKREVHEQRAAPQSRDEMIKALRARHAALRKQPTLRKRQSMDPLQDKQKFSAFGNAVKDPSKPSAPQVFDDGHLAAAGNSASFDGPGKEDFSGAGPGGGVDTGGDPSMDVPAGSDPGSGGGGDGGAMKRRDALHAWSALMHQRRAEEAAKLSRRHALARQILREHALKKDELESED